MKTSCSRPVSIYREPKLELQEDGILVYSATFFQLLSEVRVKVVKWDTKTLGFFKSQTGDMALRMKLKKDKSRKLKCKSNFRIGYKTCLKNVCVSFFFPSFLS